ncbi:MAG: methionyl-tRNA formyltransferase [Rickettsiaceae bacterium]|nr:methionyl-tRNA formyltransferase [Rickettsiaceae bacterium]
MDIIFMGTPEFAVPSLQTLLKSEKHCVKAVFTKEPKEQNRGMELIKSPIHQLAEKYNIDIYHPKTLRNSEIVSVIDNIKADIIIVVAYGLIIPANILNIKKYGCLNIHPSRLPKYRGAAPLQRTIINNEEETSICIIQMDEGVDTGDILAQKDIKIPKDMELKELHDICAVEGAELLLNTLDNIDNIIPHKQSEHGVSYASKLSKEEGKINWQKEDGLQIYGKIKGMNPWPGAYFFMNGKMIKIISASWKSVKHAENYGNIMSNKFDVACRGGILRIEKIKPEGKNEMSGESFLRGYNITYLS